MMYKLLKAGQTHRSEGVTVSATHVKQSYKCKTSRQVRRDNGTFPVLCQGHHGSWSWNLQRHVWQLDGKPAVITKVLPGNVLELADLIGSPACCTGDESEYSQQGW